MGFVDLNQRFSTRVYLLQWLLWEIVKFIVVDDDTTHSHINAECDLSLNDLLHYGHETSLIYIACILYEV